MLIPAPNLQLAQFTMADVPARPEPFRLLNRVPIHDNGEPLVDLRVTNPELSFADYCFPYVRISVAEALTRATRNTPDDLDLRVFTALRTLDQQAEMYWNNYERAQREHPSWSKAVLRRMTNRFFAPPDSKAPPGHCTGAAVDVGIFVRATGEPLDVRSPLEGWEAAPTSATGLSPEAAENRRRLCFIMHSTGLSNCRDEYWHWSYGDSAWAVRMEVPAACYGLIEPPPDATRVVGAKVVQHPYDPQWPVQFEHLRTSLGALLDRDSAVIEHLGSTAIPGLAADPILDIGVFVREEAQTDFVIQRLVASGYRRNGDEELAYLTQPSPPESGGPITPNHRIVVATLGGSSQHGFIAIRERLRADPRLRAAYADLKATLARSTPWDRVRYDSGKQPFLDRLVAD